MRAYPRVGRLERGSMKLLKSVELAAQQRASLGDQLGRVRRSQSAPEHLARERLIMQADGMARVSNRGYDLRICRAPAEVPSGAHTHFCLYRRHANGRSGMLIDVVAQQQAWVLGHEPRIGEPRLQGEHRVPLREREAQKPAILAPARSRQRAAEARACPSCRYPSYLLSSRLPRGYWLLERFMARLDYPAR